MPDGMIKALLILGGILIFTILISLPKRKGKKITRVYAAEATWSPPQPAAQPQDEEPYFQTAPDTAIPFHSMKVGVGLPLAWAGASAAIFSITAFVIALLANATFATAARIFGGVAVGVLAIGWIVGLMTVRGDWKRTLYRLEEATGLDLDNDKQVGNPKTVNVNVTHRDAGGVFTHQNRHVFSMTDKQAEALAIGILLGGKPFTEDTWAGSGKPFSQNELTALRREFIEAEIISQRGRGNAGYEFNEIGKTVLREFLPETLQNVPLTHLPAVRGGQAGSSTVGGGEGAQ